MQALAGNGTNQSWKGKCHMKRIEALVEPAKVKAIRTALSATGIRRLSLQASDEAADQRTEQCICRGRKFPEEESPEVRLELVLADALVDEAVNAIVGASGHVRLTVSDLAGDTAPAQHVGIYRGRAYEVVPTPATRIEMEVTGNEPGNATAAIEMTPTGVRVMVADVEELAAHKELRGMYRGHDYHVAGFPDSHGLLQHLAA
jgi:nitrogen regulatory protein P-II 1